MVGCRGRGGRAPQSSSWWRAMRTVMMRRSEAAWRCMIWDVEPECGGGGAAAAGASGGVAGLVGMALPWAALSCC